MLAKMAKPCFFRTHTLFSKAFYVPTSQISVRCYSETPRRYLPKLLKYTLTFGPQALLCSSAGVVQNQVRYKTMEQYLTAVQKGLGDLSSFQCVHIVVGNESCDLDSAVSALTYAFYLSQTSKESSTLALPLLNIPRAQYNIHTETVYAFNKLNVTPEHLLFIGQIDLPKLAANDQLKLTLVDHNVLTGQLSQLDGQVVNVIDHHEKEREEKEGVKLKLATVGSCCTLVAEELLDDPDFTLDETVAELLYGTILIDTVNRSSEAGKITPRDDAALERLSSVIPSVDGDKLYAEIQAAKLDMSSLTNMDILEKDLKMVSGTAMVIAMSSVTMDVQELLSRPNFQADLEAFCSSKQADVVVVMAMTTDKDGAPARQLAVYSTNRIYRDQIADVLDNTCDVDLDLEPVFAPFDDVSVFLQGNTKASRKIVMPVLGSFLHGDGSPDVPNKDFVAEPDVSMEMEGFAGLSNIMESSAENIWEKQPAKVAISKPDFLKDNSDKFEDSTRTKGDHSSSTQMQIVGQHLTSGHMSSANSSTLFDFLTSGSSELMDPFSSVEENNPAESSPVKKEGSDLSDTAPSNTNTENSADLVPSKESGAEIKSVQSDIMNPFSGNFNEKLEQHDNSIDSKNPFGNIMDDFDPLGSGNNTEGNSYVMFDPFEPKSDTSENNPFSPNATSFENPFGQNDAYSAPMNPFQQNETSDDVSERTLEPLSSHSSESNPFGPNVMDLDPFGLNDISGASDAFSGNPFMVNASKISSNNSNQDPFEPNAVTTISDFFGANVQTTSGKVVTGSMPAPVTAVTDTFCSDVAMPMASEMGVTGAISAPVTTITDAMSTPVTTITEAIAQLEHQSSNSSDITDEESQARLNYLGIGTEGGPRAKARKSISLIVEYDRESDEEDNLAELDEADFYDKVPSPEADKSGCNSPFINPGFATPFERLRSERNSESGSGFHSVVTPPNSLMEDGIDSTRPKDRDLPSFNNAEMVERIKNKKRNMGSGEGSVSSMEFGLVSTPYTPQNSFRDDADKHTRAMDLLLFDDDKMTERVKEKRNSLGVFSPVDLDGAQQLADFGAASKEATDSFQNDFEDFSTSGDLLSASLVPSAPANSYIEKNDEFKSSDTVSGMELFDKLTNLQDGNEEAEDDFGLLDFSNDASTTSHGNSSQTQPGLQFLCDMNDENVNQSSIHDIADLSLGLDQEMTTNLKTVEEMAQKVAVETVSNTMTKKLLHEAVDKFPDMENPPLAECVAVEVLMGDNSNWTNQGSWDSGIASNDSPQQARPKSPRSPRSPMHRRANEYQYSVETEYLPSMDPLHGNLNIVTSPSSHPHTIETDADKEVVESESFRKFSGQGRELAVIDTASLEAASEVAMEMGTRIRSMIVQENLVSSQPSIEGGTDRSGETEDSAGSNSGIESCLTDIQDICIQKDSESMNEDSPLNSDLEDKSDDSVNIQKDSESMNEESPPNSDPEDIPKDSVMPNTSGANEDYIEIKEDDSGKTHSSGEILEISQNVPDLERNEKGGIADNSEMATREIEEGRHTDKTDGTSISPDERSSGGMFPDKTDGNSISPDSSSSFTSTTDSESELITVFENVHGAQRSPDIDDKKSEVETVFDNKTRWRETETSNANKPDKIVHKSELTENEPESIGNEPRKTGIELDAGNESGLTENASEQSENESQQTGKKYEPSYTFPVSSDSLTDVTMTESSLTEETISPADTPNDECGAGFYEVNPEVRETDKPNTAELGESFFSTNLGENETGFYELNPEMNRSGLVSSASESFIEYETDTKNVTEASVEDFKVDERTPAINIADYDDSDSESSDEDSDNTQSYDMNAKLKGTVLQNIDIGHAFSPIESPNDDSFNLNYQINPMVMDNDIDITENEESDNADDLFTNYTEGPQFEDTSLRHDEKFIEMAETMVTEAITGALDTFQEMHFKKNEQFIMSEIASAVKEGNESSDSDNSSTTTEGSYRIPHSQEESPVMSPEVDSFMKEHASKGVKTFSKEDNVIHEEEGLEDPKKSDQDNVIHEEEVREDSKKSEEDNVIHEEEGLEEDSRKSQELRNVDGMEEGIVELNEMVQKENDIRIREDNDDVRNGNIFGDMISSNDTEENTTEVVSDYQETKTETPHDTLIANDPDTYEHSKPNAETNIDCVLTGDSVEIEPEGLPVVNSTLKQAATVEVTATDVKEDLTNIEELINIEESTKIEEVATIEETSAVDEVPDSGTEENKENVPEAVHAAAAAESKAADLKQQYVTRKEIFYTSAGRMSISIDSVVDPPGAGDNMFSVQEPDIIHEENESNQVGAILAQAESAVGEADNLLSHFTDTMLGFIQEPAHSTDSLISKFTDSMLGFMQERARSTTSCTIHSHNKASPSTQPVDEDDDVDLVEIGKAIPPSEPVKPSKPVKPAKQVSHGKMKDMEETQEWHEDPIPGMAAQEEASSDSESDSDSDSDYTKPVRPHSLLQGGKRKKRIAAHSNMLGRDSADDLVEGADDLPTPDDLSTPDDMEGEELEWEDDTPITPIEPKKFAEYGEDEMEREQRENTQFRKVEIAGKDYRVDMHVIEPYKKVLSHGGYYGDGLNAIILFCGCYLPDRARRDYQYVMDNLFLYVISTLELLVAEDYMIVYFHGATPRRQMPSFGWLKRCYQMIDRRLRKNLKALLMVHPTLWLKTVVMMTKPFISTKFSSKLRFVKTLHELGKIVPMEYIYVPDPVTQYDRRLKQHRTSSSSASNSTPVSPTSPS